MEPLIHVEQAKGLFQRFEVEPEEARGILRHQKDPVYGFSYSLNPYRGCSHGCQYCYVREYPAQVPGQPKGVLHDPAAWGQWIVPKMNAPELLWAQRHKLHGETVFMASATDPYQPIEREYRLSRKCLQVLLSCPTTRVVVHTRSPLILQDLELIRSFGERLSVGFSIPTDDDTVRQVVEPQAPPIPTRWATVERLSRAGVRVTLGASPLMHLHDVGAFVRRAKESGVRSAWVGGLRLLPHDPFFDLLRQHHWLHILEPAYAEGVRQAMHEVFPRKSRKQLREEAKDEEKVAKIRVAPISRQPGLFDAVG